MEAEEEIYRRLNAVEITQGRHEERIADLEDDRARQNGSLQRLEGKMDSLSKWLIGLLGGVIASLVLLIANILIYYRG